MSDPVNNDAGPPGNTGDPGNGSDFQLAVKDPSGKPGFLSASAQSIVDYNNQVFGHAGGSALTFLEGITTSASAGAALGSVVPGIGTAVGAFTFGFAGWGASLWYAAHAKPAEPN